MKRAAQDASLSSSSSRDRPNKRARQRELKKVAHHISTQADNANSAKSSSSIPSSSKKLIKLPGQILADKYLDSCAYEIRAVQDAIRTSSVGSSIRAWQMLPRHKRRRNASHNLLSLPRRLREKGRAELRASNTESRSRSDTRRRRGKGDRSAIGAYPRRKESSRRSVLVERASKAALTDKAWMETHLWHAKRFRMSSVEGKKIGSDISRLVDRWGFTLAEESSMKSHRSTWRDQKKYVTAMDCSYYSWIRVAVSVGASDNVEKCNEGLAKILRRAGMLDGWQEEWHDGERCCYTILTEAVKDATDIDEGTKAESHEGTKAESHDGFGCIARGPVQVIWLSLKETPTSSQRKRREALCCVHPAAAAKLQRSLHLAVIALSREIQCKASITPLSSVPHPLLSAGSGSIGRQHSKEKSAAKGKAKTSNSFEEAMQRKWLKAEAYNTFQIAGKEAGTLLYKVLRPINKEDARKAEAIRLGDMDSGAVIPLEVHDPRLSFPPKKATRRIDKASDKVAAVNEEKWPYSKLFAQGGPLPTFRKGEIDRRRSRLATPGARLLPTSRDDVIPVVVIAAAEQSGFTLLVPRGWGQAFWLSLVHPGTRILGQVQAHALALDAGKPYFPSDWTGTPGYRHAEAVDSLAMSKQWLRKPPAKRCNYDKVGVRWPFGGPELWKEVSEQGQRFSQMTEEEDRGKEPQPWLYTPSPSLSIASLCEEYQRWREHRDHAMSPSLQLIRSALVCVKVMACRKGSFERWDEIHLLEQDAVQCWKRALEQIQRDSHDKTALQRLEQSRLPSSSSHIGSVVTGNFNLSKGKVSALASMSLLALLEILTSQKCDLEPEEGGNAPTSTQRNPIPLDNLVLVKSTQGGVARIASIQLAALG